MLHSSRQAPRFDSAPRLLGRSAAVFFGNLPAVALLTLSVMIPGNLLVQALCSLGNVPADGILSYLFLEMGDLVFGAWAAAAVIYAVGGKLRIGRMPGMGEALGRGRRLWLPMFWNQFKVEITVGLWSLLVFIPGFMALVRLFLVQPIVVLEPEAAEPLRRSEELTRGARWRIFFVALPMTLVDLAGSFVVFDALPGVGHSRVLLALADSALAVIGQWSIVAALLIYLGRTGAAAATASPARGSRASHPGSGR